MGWMGKSEQVEHALGVVGADRDENGKFLIYTAPVASFLGLGEELVVGQDTEYSVGGHRNNLAALMNSTSYGIRGIHVIGCDGGNK